MHLSNETCRGSSAWQGLLISVLNVSGTYDSPLMLLRSTHLSNETCHSSSAWRGLLISVLNVSGMYDSPLMLWRSMHLSNERNCQPSEATIGIAKYTPSNPGGCPPTNISTTREPNQPSVARGTWQQPPNLTTNRPREASDSTVPNPTGHGAGTGQSSRATQSKKRYTTSRAWRYTGISSYSRY